MHLHSVLADSKAVARQVQTLILEEKMKKSGAGGGGGGMGSKSGQAHALGCPEWVPWGYGPQEYVLGTLWWFLCPSAPIHTIHTDADNISSYTFI